MIRVLIADDSLMIREFIKQILNSDPEIQVAGLAKNGQECIEKVKLLKPDVITMDIHMPVMDGLEATRYIMENIPASILIVSSLVKSDVDITFRALKIGALDVIEKPKIKKGSTYNEIGEGIINKVKIVAKVHPFKKFKKSAELNYIVPKTDKKKLKPPTENKLNGEDGLLVIGSSTGGPPVLNYILKKIPPEFPFPIIITQHIAKGFLGGLIDWLNKDCHLNIKKGKNNEVIKKGTIYFAPDNSHLGIAKERTILLSDTPPIRSHRPSVDFLMNSAASVYKHRCMGVILTGMGRDGSQGMLAIRKSGGFTISQDEQSCAIFGMPKAAIDIGATMKICSINHIPDEIVRWVPKKINN